MSRPPNRHKRQRSSAQNVTFNTSESTPQNTHVLHDSRSFVPTSNDPPPFSSAHVLPVNTQYSRDWQDPQEGLQSSNIDPNVDPNMANVDPNMTNVDPNMTSVDPNMQNNPLQNIPMRNDPIQNVDPDIPNNPNIQLVQGSLHMQNLHNPNLEDVLPNMTYRPGSERNLPGNFGFSGMEMFHKPPSASPAGNLSFSDVIGNSPFNMPFSGAPPRNTHTKNISISSHLDMFSLGDNYGKFEVQQPQQKSSRRIPEQETTSKAESTPKKEIQEGVAPEIPHLMFLPHEYELCDHILQSLVPQLSVVNVSNFHHFLLSVLLEKRLFLCIDDLYNLLFHAQTFNHYFQSTHPTSKIDKSLPTGSVPAGIMVSQNVLGIFEHPNYCSSIKPGAQEKLASIKTQELLRSFLALKIITSLVIYEPERSSPEPQVTDSKDVAEPTEPHKKVHEKNALPRVAIYKMYYILCRKLMRKYGSELIGAENRQKVILGNAIIGKLIKLVYPGIKSKRLGSRGDSKYNYLGMRWNESVVNEEMQRLCNEELSEIDEIFKPYTATEKAEGPFFPIANCDPDFWGEKGTRASWFRTAEKKSMKKLADSNVETLFLEADIFQRFILDQKWVRDNIMKNLRLLSGQRPLSSLLFLLTARTFSLFWSRFVHKQDLVTLMESVNAETAAKDNQTYLKFLKRLLVLADFLQPNMGFEAEIPKNALSIVISCINSESFREMVSQSVFRTLQAFELVAENKQMVLVSTITASICSIPDILWTEIMSEMEGPACSSGQVVRVLARVLHREILAASWTCDVPIRVAMEMILMVTNTGQKAVFDMNKGSGVFKIWSFLAFATQQYMLVMSEIITLGQKVKET